MERRFVAGVVLPEGVDGDEALACLPEGTLKVGEFVPPAKMMSRDDWNIIGRGLAWAMHMELLKEKGLVPVEHLNACAEMRERANRQVQADIDEDGCGVVYGAMQHGRYGSDGI